MLSKINGSVNPLLQYELAGFSLCNIPLLTKGPTEPGWNAPGYQFRYQGAGIGLRHVESNTVSLDIDNLALARAELSHHDILLDWLMMSGVQIRSGMPNRAKLIYRIPAWMSGALTTRKVKVLGDHAFELRHASAEGQSMQDVLPPSIHPDTFMPYQWIGDFTQIPPIPPELLSYWIKLLSDKQPVQNPTASPQPVKWDEVTDALSHIDPDCSREEWVQCGMAIHSTGNPVGFDLWDSWSSKGAKYKKREMPQQWNSFKVKPDGITINSLFHIAYRHGYRPQVDVAGLFGDVTLPEPKQLSTILSPDIPPPQIDLNLWPTVLADRAREVSQEVGCDPAVPLAAGMAAVCAAIDGRTRLKLSETFKVPPVLWLMTVGEPSDKKSPGSRPMFEILRTMEREDRPRYEVEALAWKGYEARYNAQMKAFQTHWGSVDAQMTNTVPPGVEALPPAPEPLRLTINDATSQKLVHLTAQRPQGLLLHLDEMNHWLTRINDHKSGDDRSCWIQGYEASGYTMDRVGSGSTAVDNLAVAIYGNIQPTVFREHLVRTAADGLLQRFIPFVLAGDATRMPEDIVPRHRDEYEQLIRRTRALPVTEYTLSPQAKAAYQDFQRWYLRFRQYERTARSSTYYQTAFGKIEGTCARTALLFHVVEAPYSLEVSADTMHRAINATMMFIVPSLRHVFTDMAGKGNELGQAVMQHVVAIAGIEESVSVNTMRNTIRRVLPDAPIWQQNQDIMVHMDNLAEHGYLKLMPGPDSDLRTGRAKYAINPDIARTFAEYRRNVIRANQAIIDVFRTNIKRTYGVDSRRPDARGLSDVEDIDVLDNPEAPDWVKLAITDPTSQMDKHQKAAYARGELTI